MANPQNVYPPFPKGGIHFVDPARDRVHKMYTPPWVKIFFPKHNFLVILQGPQNVYPKGGYTFCGYAIYIIYIHIYSLPLYRGVFF